MTCGETSRCTSFTGVLGRRAPYDPPSVTDGGPSSSEPGSWGSLGCGPDGSPLGLGCALAPSCPHGDLRQLAASLGVSEDTVQLPTRRVCGRSGLGVSPAVTGSSQCVQLS